MDAKDQDGRDALHFVSGFYKGRNLIEIVRLLIEKGIDVTQADDDGDNALILLRLNSTSKQIQAQVADLLISKGIDIEHKNNEGNTAADISKELEVKEKKATGAIRSV